MNAAMNAATSAPSAPSPVRHEQLTQMLSELCELNNHLFSVAQGLGVPIPIETPNDTKKAPVHADNLVGVLNMLPDAAGFEIRKAHDILANISNALR